MSPTETYQASDSKGSASHSDSKVQPATRPKTTDPPQPGASTQAEPTSTTSTGEEKLSNAELKKRAKAEKQAKRAQKKVDQGVAPTQAGPSGSSQPTQQQQKQKGPSTPKEASASSSAATPKHQGKQTQSQSKGLPHRPAHITAQTQQETIPVENKNVALFGHLYNQPRRKGIDGVSSNVYRDVLELGLKMSNYVACGSSARVVYTLMVFKKMIESYVTPPGTSLQRNLTSLLSPQIEYLVSCRPLSISTGNAIRWLKLLISDVDIETPEEKAKLDLCEAIDNFIREKITITDQLIASTASSKIKDGDTILTYAKSNVVARTLLQAHASGTKFRVIVIDSRPLFEGKNLARQLVAAGLNVQYSLIHAISHLMQSATKVFLGAHAMFSNGRLYSRVGTASVAMTANKLAKQVIVCCESIKFTDHVALDSIVKNEAAPPNELLLPERAGQEQKQALASWKELPNLQLLNLKYDVTPADYIDMVITEYGSLPPSSVMSIYRLSSST